MTVGSRITRKKTVMLGFQIRKTVPDVGVKTLGSTATAIAMALAAPGTAATGVGAGIGP